MRLTLDHNTDNGRLMLDADVMRAVTGGIDDPSDAVIPAETSLYRVAHKMYFNRTTKSFEKNPPERAYQSPWWTTNYYFNSAVWASDEPDMSHAARAAFAIHPDWKSDCSNYASIVTRTDLSVWYGLGKVVSGPDPLTGANLDVHPSAEVLQVYIPGFADNFRRWVRLERVIAFEDRVSNGRGFQGHLPLGLRPGSV